MQAIGLWRTRDTCGKSPEEADQSTCKRMKIMELRKICRYGQPREKSTGKGKRFMNRGETGQKICRSRLRAENCSTWNNFVGPRLHPGGISVRRRISQGTFASARFQIVPRGTIWKRTALNSGCPQVVMASLRRLWRFGPEEDSRNCSTWNNLALRLRLTVASGKGPG